MTSRSIPEVVADSSLAGDSAETPCELVVRKDGEKSVGKRLRVIGADQACVTNVFADPANVGCCDWKAAGHGLKERIVSSREHHGKHCDSGPLILGTEGDIIGWRAIIEAGVIERPVEVVMCAHRDNTRLGAMSEYNVRGFREKLEVAVLRANNDDPWLIGKTWRGNEEFCVGPVRYNENPIVGQEISEPIAL